MLPPKMNNEQFRRFLIRVLDASAAKKIILVGVEAKAAVIYPNQIPTDTSKIIGYVLPPMEKEYEEGDTRHFAFTRDYIPHVNLITNSLGDAVAKIRKTHRECNEIRSECQAVS